MRLCIERLVPVRKGRPIIFDLPPVETAFDISKALGVIAKSMAAGELTDGQLYLRSRISFFSPTYEMNA
jgi:hypothetical protein